MLLRADSSVFFFLALSGILSGCATPQSVTQPPESGGTRSSPAPYNLSGYSAGFKQGYADACATPRRRNSERFKTDGDYSMGWNDGHSMCPGR